jgi:hypothetical protein
MHQDFTTQGEGKVSWEYATFNHASMDTPQPQISKMQIILKVLAS